MEEREKEYLSPCATLSMASRGRKRNEPQCDIRPVFQRDRDRILHSKAFRRMKQKTQVFLLPIGDHYRTRLTHTPFGHAGERALNNVCPCGFKHNEQSVRVVEVLEKHGEGLNLTWEVLDGIRNHKSAGMPATLEGQIVRLSDKIAYVNHDIDDAVRAGIMNEEELPKELRKVLGNSKRERLNTLTHDVIVNSMDKPKICMSEEVREALMELRTYMFTHVYENPLAKGEEDKAIRMVEDLYSYYETHMEKMPEQYLKQLQKGEMPEIAVCDYIAGMTDNFAVKKFEEIFIPQSWKF